jgi:hypothetical protein
MIDLLAIPENIELELFPDAAAFAMEIFEPLSYYLMFGRIPTLLEGTR